MEGNVKYSKVKAKGGKVKRVLKWVGFLIVVGVVFLGGIKVEQLIDCIPPKETTVVLRGQFPFDTIIEAKIFVVRTDSLGEEVFVDSAEISSDGTFALRNVPKDKTVRVVAYSKSGKIFYSTQNSFDSESEVLVDSSSIEWEVLKEPIKIKLTTPPFRGRNSARWRDPPIQQWFFNEIGYVEGSEKDLLFPVNCEVTGTPPNAYIQAYVVGEAGYKWPMSRGRIDEQTSTWRGVVSMRRGAKEFRTSILLVVYTVRNGQRVDVASEKFEIIP